MYRPLRSNNKRVDGHYWMYCQRCGFKTRNDHIKREWTGLLVCDSTVHNCFEERNIQDFVRGIPDKQSVFPASDYDTGAGYVGSYTEAICGIAQCGSCFSGNWYLGRPGT